MKADKLLDEILQMLYSFKENQNKLENLHEYIADNLYEESTEEKINIPLQHSSLIKDIAGSLDAGFVCYLNPKTLEKEEIPEGLLDEFSFDMDDADNPFGEALKRTEQKWEECIVIQPPDSFEAFQFMEDFAEFTSDKNLSKKLSEALSRNKPFSHFKNPVDNSSKRNAWFEYKQKCLERYTINELAENVEGIA